MSIRGWFPSPQGSRAGSGGPSPGSESGGGGVGVIAKVVAALRDREDVHRRSGLSGTTTPLTPCTPMTTPSAVRFSLREEGDDDEDNEKDGGSSITATTTNSSAAGVAVAVTSDGSSSEAEKDTDGLPRDEFTSAASSPYASPASSALSSPASAPWQQPRLALARGSGGLLPPRTALRVRVPLLCWYCRLYVW